jgi:hypothetical protein
MKNIKAIIVSIILAVITVYAFFETPLNALHGFLGKYGLANKDWARCILVFFTTLLTLILVWIISFLLKRTKTLLINIKTKPRALWAEDASGERIHDFQTLRIQATESIYVMGIGATYFSNDLSLLNRLLEKDLEVRILIMDPSVIASSRSARSRKDTPGMMIMEDSFDAFFVREGYHSDVKSSCSRLVNYVAGKRSENPQAKIELRLYRDLMPLNFTAIDETGNGKILLEFCLPFSDKRLRMHFSKQYQEEVYKEILEITDNMWKNARPIPELLTEEK